ncbi:hydrogenase expression protein [candidate division MSBL1 archaeon SCGC-AAA259A05]|uniref:Hydrogenase expression protein n=1 Tax=candidate division MSBL1 archaeon SCGC-AAA259A05 TaxID=1698259 RepID=A0A133U5I9_9EURY|nr:hydrogenase expression protein [candidate division MSBL1 archaeon SCGC-AAA259A05]
MRNKKISLEHGAGGKAMMNLIKQIAIKEISEKKVGPVGLNELDDGAAIDIGDENLIFTTDSHTIKPLFFPGGDIGKLAIAGTVNDLAVMGGKPLALSSAMVLSEGFPSEDLKKIIQSMNATAQKAGISLVTGDTKVMEKESLDEMIITTTGIGLANSLKTDGGLNLGDKIIVTGNIGEHETAIITRREGIEIGEGLRSDVAPIWDTVEAGLKIGGITAMKDPTRGGLAGTLNELASKSNIGISIYEDEIPIPSPVRNIGELLGIDPLQLTNEGKAVIGVEPERSKDVLEAIRKTENGKEAQIIGKTTKKPRKKVVLETEVGGKRLVRAPIGAPTPRIC